MTILTPGHRYALQNFENGDQAGQILQFIEKEPDPHGGEVLLTVHDGATNEELLRVLIDRLNFMNTKFPCSENSIAITNLETALMFLEKRTRDRKARGVEGKALA